MKYSFNQDKTGVVFANAKDLNASYKDLCAVCDAIRYRTVGSAMDVLNEVSKGEMAIRFRRHNRYMGGRHELAGGTGRFPKKCASIVRKVLVNAYANAKNKGYEPEMMHVIHASANQTLIAPRAPPRGVRRSVSSGGYGYTTMRKSNLEFSQVEIGISSKYKDRMGKNSVRLIDMFAAKSRRAEEKNVSKPKAKTERKQAVVKKAEVKTEAKSGAVKTEAAKVAVKS